MGIQPSIAWPRAWGAVMRRAGAALVAAMVSLTGCHEDGVAPIGPTLVRMSIASRVAGTVTQADRPTVAVTVRYLSGPGGNAATTLGTSLVALDDAPGPVNIPVEFDLAPCLADRGRATSSDDCEIVVSLALRLGSFTVDTASVGPVTVSVGRTVSVPQSVELRSVSRLQILWPGQTSLSNGDTIRVGGSLQLTARPLDAAGAVMAARAITWSSGSPSVASVDATTGIVTAVSPGTAIISASGGGRVASFTARAIASIEIRNDYVGSIFLEQRGDVAPGQSASFVSSEPIVVRVWNCGKPGELTCIMDPYTVLPGRRYRVMTHPNGPPPNLTIAEQ